ncbi:Hypothetical predicted protein [Podarcis lilfordi]|uniref:Uncharacterized protein n=1 Tax=Podarcis lilfordi TaxID=74358 RepID=A0AA35KKW9_9SAUR|nr:Hypothetical predicted protein [Podarcis lilfordi]
MFGFVCVTPFLFPFGQILLDRGEAGRARQKNKSLGQNKALSQLCFLAVASDERDAMRDTDIDGLPVRCFATDSLPPFAWW